MIEIYRISKMEESSVDVPFSLISEFAYWRHILELNMAWPETRW